MALNTQRILELVMQYDFEGITALCKQDILEQAAKQKGGASLVKRTKKAQKYINSLDEWQMRGCGAAMINYQGKEMQQITNTYFLFLLNEPLEGIDEPTKEPFKADECFGDWGNRIETPLNIPAIKMHIAECKALKQSTKTRPFQIDGVYYNPQYILDVMEILGGEITFYQDNEKPHQPAFFKSENGLALLCPVRQPKEADA